MRRDTPERRMAKTGTRRRDLNPIPDGRGATHFSSHSTFRQIVSPQLLPAVVSLLGEPVA
jgi:hypothetical protein